MSQPIDDYTVTWQIEVPECKSALQAARYAEHMQQANTYGYNASVFTVTDSHRKSYRVDLSGPEPIVEPL